MRNTFLSTAYKRDVKRLKRQQKPLELLGEVVDLLIREQSLPAHCRDHALKGRWRGCRELHIEPDWLLVYEIKGNTLYLDRTGSHAELFQS